MLLASQFHFRAPALRSHVPCDMLCEWLSPWKTPLTESDSTLRWSSGRRRKGAAHGCTTPAWSSCPRTSGSWRPYIKNYLLRQMFLNAATQRSRERIYVKTISCSFWNYLVPFTISFSIDRFSFSCRVTCCADDLLAFKNIAFESDSALKWSSARRRKA